MSAPASPGDELLVLHTCQHRSIEVEHVAYLRVVDVVRLHSGQWRVAATRCDASTVHVVLNADGSDSTGHITGRRTPAVTS